VIHDVTPDGVERTTVDPLTLGLRRAPTSRLAGGTPEENARTVEAILNGEPGARRDVVVLNAGAALHVAGAVDSLVDGVDRAALTIDAGLAGDLLVQLRAQRRTAEDAATAAAARAAETPA
jgi:anthranilate phosphoribosyltransferase